MERILCGIIADVLSDGGLCYSKKGRNYRTYFASKDFDAVIRFREEMLRLFKKEAHITRHKNGVYEATIYSKQIFDYLKKLGLPVGRKADAEYSLPNIIKRANTQAKAEFLRRFFDAEASVRDRGRKWEISISQVKREDLIDSGVKFLLEIKQLLKEFEVDAGQVWIENKGKTRVDGSKTRRICFSICNIHSIKNYSEKIGFYNKRKKRILQKISQKEFPETALTEKINREGQTILVARDSKGRFIRVFKAPLG